VWNGFSALATVYQSDGSAASVQGLHNAALNGDTITIPVGTFTWTTKVTISKSITLQGTGIGSTIIKDGVQSGQLIAIGLVAGQLTRLTGIEFQDGGRTNTQPAPGGIIRVDGSNTNGSLFRWDHCKWDNLNGYPVTDTVIGVIDHNEILIGRKVREWIYPYCNKWNGGTWGDGSWSAPANYGSSQFLFIEDNNITSSHATIEGTATDGFGGARFVLRHNNIFGLDFGNHGTESPGRGRSNRAMDVYANHFDGNNLNRYGGSSRGGSVLFHDNTLVHYWGNPNTINTLSAFRMLTSFFVWVGADGTNGWDENNPGNPFYSGTASSASGRTVTISANPWTANQWSGYTIKKTSGTGGFAYILSNTSNTLSYAASGFGRDLVMAAGDAFVINKVDQSVDQPGAGVSSPLSGDTPTPPPGWTQGVEPCYSWNNTNDGQPFNNFNAEELNIKAGVHYFNNTVAPGYVAYTYPHPLVTGASPTPSPSASPSPTSTPSATPSTSPTPSATPTATATPSATATPRHTPRPRPSHAPEEG
jgi:hypothetical protein